MAIFENALKNNFWKNGVSPSIDTARVCLLRKKGTVLIGSNNVEGEGLPLGSNTVERVSAFIHNADDFVDMGLPSGTLWAKKNLGALKETDNGYYFSWGNLDGHAEGAGYNFSRDVYDGTTGSSISADLTLAQDAARANRGGAWKMPTIAQFQELCNSNNTEYIDASGNVISGTDKRTTVDGVVGLRIRSKINGNIVFLPAAGLYNGTSQSADGSSGYYWSSTYITQNNCKCLFFRPEGVDVSYDSVPRRDGLSIRPVI